MSLSDLKINKHYFSPRDDVVRGFFIPVLSNSTSYDRAAGYFSSYALIETVVGVCELVKKGGKIRVISSPRLNNDDLKAIREGYNKREVLEKALIRDFEHPLDIESKDRLSLLTYLIKTGSLELKIAVMNNLDDYPDSMFHAKFGIIKDESNVVAFTGSMNETRNGLGGNWDHLTVENNGLKCESDADDLVNIFESLWLGRDPTVSIIEAPKVIDFLVENYEPDSTKLNLDKKLLDAYFLKDPLFTIDVKGVKLRKYQCDAIQKWADNKYRGIYNMATGTGKTVTAIFSLLKMLLDCSEEIITIVAVPLQHLIEDPWIKTISKIFRDNDVQCNFVKAFNDSKKWMPEAKDSLEYLNYGLIHNLIFITTYDTLSSNKFTELMKTVKNKKLLIADEVHNSGSFEHRNGLLEEYDYRLGLSATPARYLDDDGTNHLMNYFDGEVYEFSLVRAINEINPDTGKTYLTPYNYYPLFVSLNDSELAEYISYSSRIAKFIGNDNLSPGEIKAYNMLLIQRARILKNAESKMTYLVDHMPDFVSKGVIDHCLIYCSDGKDPNDVDMKSIHRVVKCLNENSIRNNTFTSAENYGERQKILETFSNGDVKALVAIKCLDEGVDVPSTKNAIIMASTGNPREYIQRRGRVLRRSKDKEYANIYDFIIVPREESANFNVGCNIFENELVRYYEFSDNSLNSKENDSKIEILLNKFGMVKR